MSRRAFVFFFLFFFRITSSRRILYKYTYLLLYVFVYLYTCAVWCINNKSIVSIKRAIRVVVVVVKFPRYLTTRWYVFSFLVFRFQIHVVRFTYGVIKYTGNSPRTARGIFDMSIRLWNNFVCVFSREFVKLRIEIIIIILKKNAPCTCTAHVVYYVIINYTRRCGHIRIVWTDFIIYSNEILRS